MIEDSWTPSDREGFIAQEKAALEKFTAAGVVLDVDAAESRKSGCTFCQWHAFDASGEELDGGTASALWGWYRDGYIATATTLRRVVGAVNLEAGECARHVGSSEPCGQCELDNADNQEG